MQVKNLIINLSGAIFLFLPWYHLEQGKPQPVDIPILLLLTTYFVLGIPYFGQILRQVKIYRIFLCFSIYVISMLLIHYVLAPNDDTLRILMFNVYGIVLLTFFFLLFIYLDVIKNDGLYDLILNLLLLDILFPFVQWVVTGHAQTRNALTFNNPNQLGFFSFVNLSIFFYIACMAKERNISLNKIKSLIILNANILFLCVSASRACYSSFILYVLSYFLIFNIRVHGNTKWLVGIIGIFLGLFFIYVVGGKLFSLMQHARFDMYTETTGSILNEFYSRAIKGAENNLTHVGSFLFGTGSYTTEGRQSLEFHNNFVAIFFQLGVIGLLLYVYMNIIIIKELMKRRLIYIVPYLCYLVYSVFHYSYRIRINWLFLALIMFVIMQDHRKVKTREGLI